MKKIEIKQLYFALQSAAKKGDAKFKYAVIKNSMKIEPEIEALKEVEKGIDEIVAAFNKEKMALIQEYGEVNEQGQYSVKIESSDKFKEFANKNKELETKHKKAIDKHDKEMKSYADLLDQESDIKFEPFKIQFDKVPKDIEDFELAAMMRVGIVE